MINTQSTTSSSVGLERPLAIIASNSSLDAYEIAQQFAENGYDLIVAAINPSVVEEAEEFKEFGIDAVSIQIDLSTKEGVEQLYKKIVATGRPLEVMVINTGISQNLTNETELAQRVLKDMADRGRGKIFFAGKDDQEDPTQACASLQADAEGSGVVVSSLKSNKVKLDFSKDTHSNSH